MCVNRGGWWGGSGGGARSSIVGWRVCVWRVGRVVGGRAHRYSSGALVFGGRGGMEGERASGGVLFLWAGSGGRARSTICWWRVGRVVGGKTLIDMMVALLCVWRARRVENDGGKGARIDIRVACVLCLASGEVTKVGEVGRAHRYSGGVVVVGGRGWWWERGGARSSIFGWCVVVGGWGGEGERAHRHSGGVLLSGRG